MRDSNSGRGGDNAYRKVITHIPAWPELQREGKGEREREREREREMVGEREKDRVRDREEGRSISLYPAIRTPPPRTATT